MFSLEDIAICKFWYDDTNSKYIAILKQERGF